MDIIPAIDVTGGRSRVVYWPGAAAGTGTPTDRPDRIAEQLVAQGARIVHLVDFDGARQQRPANLEAVGAVAARVAVPLQLAGGLEAADHVRLAFAAGATRVVLSVAIASDPTTCGRASPWPATGSPSAWTRGRSVSPRSPGGARSPRPSIRWWRSWSPTGVRRLVLSHGGVSPDTGPPRRPRASATTWRCWSPGGVADLDGVRRLRDAGVAGLILGESLLSGAIELPRALEAAA